MLYRETTQDVFEPWSGQRIDGIAYPRSIERKWTATQLAAINLYVPAPAEAVPEGKIVADTHVERVDGVVRFVHTLEDVPPPPVPGQVSARQARQALNAAGLRSQVESAVAAADQDTQDYWEYAVSIERENPVMLALSSQIGLSESQLDNLFTQAATL